MLKCDGESSDVRTERFSPSSFNVGGGNDGGGVVGLVGGTGDEAREASLEAGVVSDTS